MKNELSISYDFSAPSDIRSQVGQLLDGCHVLLEVTVLIPVEVEWLCPVDKGKALDPAILQIIAENPCTFLVKGIIDDRESDIVDVGRIEQFVHALVDSCGNCVGWIRAAFPPVHAEEDQRKDEEASAHGGHDKRADIQGLKLRSSDRDSGISVILILLIRCTLQSALETDGIADIQKMSGIVHHSHSAHHHAHAASHHVHLHHRTLVKGHSIQNNPIISKEPDMLVPSLLRSAIKIKAMGLSLAGVLNSKNNKNMQGDIGQDLLTYPQYAMQEATQFRKRIPIQQFKQLDSKRIRSQFSVLEQARISNYNKVMHLGEKQKDRYSNIHTYKHNRVVVEGLNNFYINASYMKSVLDQQVYAVFAQAPIEKVYDHFWYACYRLKIRKIVMLCSFQDPQRGRQAEKYWPELGKSFNFADLKLKVSCQAQEKESSEHTKTNIVLDSTEGSFTLQHIHWTGWSDMKKPFGEKNQGLFRNLVEDSLRLIDNKQLILIHCSAGIGRTGTLGTMIEALRCAKREKALSVFQIVDNMRRHRMACVQTFEQYSFIYQQLKVML